MARAAFLVSTSDRCRFDCLMGPLFKMASDGLSVQQARQTGPTFNAIGIAVLQTASEGQGAIGGSPYGVGSVAYQKGEMVRALMRGRCCAEWKGTTQNPFTMPNVYHSSTIPDDRGKFTDDEHRSRHRSRQCRAFLPDSPSPSGEWRYRPHRRQPAGPAMTLSGKQPIFDGRDFKDSTMYRYTRGPVRKRRSSDRCSLASHPAGT